MNLSDTLRTAKSVITANSPILLVAASIAGVVTTGVLAAKGGYKARGIVDEAEEELDRDLETVEKVRLTWLCYAAPAVTGVSAIASIVGVHTIHTKRTAAMAGLYAVASTKLDDYREKAEEMLGAKKSQQLNDHVAQRQVDRDPVKDHEVVILEGGTELMYDAWSGRYLKASVGIVDTAIANTNLLIAQNAEASLNDFYDFLGLSPIPMGLDFGWSGKPSLTWTPGSVRTTDGRSAISITIDQAPKMALGR